MFQKVYNILKVAFKRNNKAWKQIKKINVTGLALTLR